MSFNSVLALDELVYSPFTQAGGWSSGSTWGRNRAFDHDDILFVFNGNDVYKYDMSTWEYLGTESFTYNINDLKFIDGNLYLTQDDEVWKYTVDGEDITYVPSEYWNFSGTTLNSFDINANETKIVATDSTSSTLIKDMSTNEIDIVVSRSNSDMVRFSWDAEVILIADIGGYANGIWGHAVSNGANLFTHSIASNYMRYMSVSSVDDQFLSGWSYGFSDYDVYQRNFTANTDAGIRSWTGYKLPNKASYSVDGSLLMRMQAVDDLKAVYLHSSSSGSTLGSGTFTSVYTDYPEWTYIPDDNRYAIVGYAQNFRVLNTGVASPLITTVDADNDGTTTVYSGAINDIGDAYWANCSIEYKANTVSTWTESDITAYTNTSDFPDTYTFTTYSTVLGKTYDYRAKCIYETQAGVETVYGQEKEFTAVKQPFDAFTAITDNIGFIGGMILIIGIVGALARFGMTNPLVIMSLVVILSFVMTILDLFSLTTTIFVTIVCAVIAIFIYVAGGKD